MSVDDERKLREALQEIKAPPAQRRLRTALQEIRVQKVLPWLERGYNKLYAMGTAIAGGAVVIGLLGVGLYNLMTGPLQGMEIQPINTPRVSTVVTQEIPTLTPTATPTITPTPVPTDFPEQSDVSPVEQIDLDEIVSPSTEIDVLELDNFEVLANVIRNPTELSVVVGDILHFEYIEGSWTGEKGVSPYETGCGFSWRDTIPGRAWPLPRELRGAALIGYIDYEPFFIGCEPSDLIVKKSGKLFLGMSDCFLCFDDNDGALYVDISRTRILEDSSIAGPFDEHSQITVGTGAFENVSVSDGMAKFSEDWLSDNNRREVQNIRRETYPEGCAVAEYDSNKVWFLSDLANSLLVNGEEIGSINSGTGRHGFVFDYPIRKGDDICVEFVPYYGYQIVIGPDLLYHYDSYCFREYC